MTILDLTDVELNQLITHRVGNKMRDEDIVLSEKPVTLDEDTQTLLLQYFFHSVRADEFFAFHHPDGLEACLMYNRVVRFFAGDADFVALSHEIAGELYQKSVHPKIKEGELSIAHLSNIVLDGEIVEALAFFKSENQLPFLKMNPHGRTYDIACDYGFELKGLDKACIIFNTGKAEGFRVLIVDTASRSAEAQFWRDDFLGLQPVRNDYVQTNQFLGMAKEFVTRQMPEEFEVSPADRIDLLNRSVEYFKQNDTFDKQTFEKEVFREPEVIESFRSFDESYRQEYNLPVEEQFEISPQAVKKQSKVFKSVLKLDKNFHVYIHGNRQLIEQGVDENGRKYYKLYYEEEA